MGTDLSHHQRNEHREQGKVTGADGVGYTRRATKAKRSIADDLVNAGAPLVLEMYGSGQFEWFEGDDAKRTWEAVRPFATSSEGENGEQLLYLTGFC
jgi:hypothetical protein